MTAFELKNLGPHRMTLQQQRIILFLIIKLLLFKPLAIEQRFNDSMQAKAVMQNVENIQLRLYIKNLRSGF